MCPWRTLRSEFRTVGVSPAQAHSLRAVGNRVMSPISASSVVAVGVSFRLCKCVIPDGWPQLSGQRGHAVTETVTQSVAHGLVEDASVPAEVPRGRIGRPRNHAGEPRLISEEMARRLVRGWLGS
jgi:hypothetical protein